MPEPFLTGRHEAALGHLLDALSASAPALQRIGGLAEAAGEDLAVFVRDALRHSQPELDAAARPPLRVVS